MLRCKKAYWCCRAAEESSERKVVRTGSMEISGMMLASRATKNNSWTMTGEGRHKLRLVRIMALSVCLASVCWYVCNRSACYLFLTLCVFICPSQNDVISRTSPLKHSRTWNKFYTHIYSSNKNITLIFFFGSFLSGIVPAWKEGTSGGDVLKEEQAKKAKNQFFTSLSY